MMIIYPCVQTNKSNGINSYITKTEIISEWFVDPRLIRVQFKNKCQDSKFFHVSRLMLDASFDSEKLKPFYKN